MTDTVRVPREPTPEMLKAGSSTLDDFWKAQERGPTHVQEAWPGIVQIYAAMLAASPHGEGSSADVKPTDGDLWWNPANYEDGFLHWADAFENANEDGVDYSVELHRARKLPPVWGALVWIDGEQKIKIFATEAEADEARVTEGVKP